MSGVKGPWKTGIYGAFEASVEHDVRRNVRQDAYRCGSLCVFAYEGMLQRSGGRTGGAEKGGNGIFSA